VGGFSVSVSESVVIVKSLAPPRITSPLEDHAMPSIYT
jgi:hypothetical protein